MAGYALIVDCLSQKSEGHRSRTVTDPAPLHPIRAVACENIQKNCNMNIGQNVFDVHKKF